MRMTLDLAGTIVDAALKAGREHGFMPLSVAVLDPGGHLVAFKREDGSGILRFDIAFGKAWGALGMGFGSQGAVQPHARRTRPSWRRSQRSAAGGWCRCRAGCWRCPAAR